MKTIVLVALLAASACSKKSSVDSNCAAAMTKGTESLMATVKSRAGSQMQDSLTELVEKMRTTLTQRCSEDKWSAEVVECFTKLTTQAEMQACQKKLTQEQRTKLQTEMRQVMSSMRMGAAGPGHPSTLGSGAAGSGAAPGETPAAPSPDTAATPPAPAGAGSSAPGTPPAAPAAPSGGAPAAGSSASGW